MAPGTQQQPIPQPSAPADLAGLDNLPPPPPTIPAPAVQQVPQVNINEAKFRGLRDIQERTAVEYSTLTMIDRDRSYRVDTLRDDGVVIRGGGTFHKSVGDGATGGYTSGPDGTRYHNIGTAEDGRVIARHKVSPDGTVTMRPSENGPNLYPSEIQEVINGQLGLVPQGNGVYSRRGFEGLYSVQIEKDGSFSIFYSGGRNSAHQRCYAQTYHHGTWDEGRSRSLVSKDPEGQQKKWAQWRAREDGDATSVSVAHSEPVAKAGSGFHTSTASITAGEGGKLTTAAPLTDEPQRKNIAKITADRATWSGTFVHDPGETGQPDRIPPTFSFACQHNGQSGILNIKHSTLQADEVPAIVRKTYELAVNENIERTNGEQGFSSLLTDKKMLLDEGEGKQKVVILKPNGDVVDVTTNNIYSIQVIEGEPIRWVEKPYTEEVGNPSKSAEPTPSASPNLTGDPDVATPPAAAEATPQAAATGLTEQQIEDARSNNEEKVLILTSELLDRASPSTLLPVKDIIAPESIADRNAVSSAMKVTNESDESAYAFSRRAKDADGQSQGAMLFVRENELTGDDRTVVQETVHQAYEAATQDDGTIKIENWFALPKEDGRHITDGYARIRSDGSVECKYVAVGASAEAAPTNPESCQIIVPIQVNEQDPTQGIKWDVITDCTWNAETGRTERAVKDSADTASPKTNSEEPETSPKIKPVSAQATKMAETIYTAMYTHTFDDDEKLFVETVQEAAKTEGLIRDVNNELHRLHGKTIIGIMQAQGVGGWFGISQADVDKLNTALNGFNEAPTSKYEPPVYEGSSDSTPLMSI